MRPMHALFNIGHIGWMCLVAVTPAIALHCPKYRRILYLPAGITLSSYIIFNRRCCLSVLEHQLFTDEFLGDILPVSYMHIFITAGIIPLVHYASKFGMELGY